MEKLISIKETADFLGVGETTVRKKLLKLKEFPASRIGSQWRIDKTKLEMWIIAQQNREITQDIEQILVEKFDEKLGKDKGEKILKAIKESKTTTEIITALYEELAIEKDDDIEGRKKKIQVYSNDNLESTLEQLEKEIYLEVDGDALDEKLSELEKGEETRILKILEKSIEDLKKNLKEGERLTFEELDKKIKESGVPNRLQNDVGRAFFHWKENSKTLDVLVFMINLYKKEKEAPPGLFDSIFKKLLSIAIYGPEALRRKALDGIGTMFYKNEDIDYENQKITQLTGMIKNREADNDVRQDIVNMLAASFSGLKKNRQKIGVFIKSSTKYHTNDLIKDFVAIYSAMQEIEKGRILIEGE